jgi:Ca2+-binding RTX toxin-like protein
MATAITIHGGTGSDAINFAFTVTGENTTAFAQQFADNVNALIAPGGEQPTTLLPSGTPGAVPGGALPPVYVLDPNGVTNATFSVLTAGYVIDTIGGGSTVDLSGSDTVLVEGTNTAADIVGSGGNNEVVFVNGNNTYDGSGDSVGNDTVVAGSGFDTITTGTGSTTVYSGTGQSVFTLNDTAVGGVNDIAYLNDGQSTVYANGVSDQVWATVGHETIIDGSTIAGSTLGVVLGSFGSDGANLVSVTGGATTTVFNNTGNDTIDAGSGTLNVYDAGGTVTYVNTGSGNTIVFGAANTVVVLGSQGAGGTATYIASGGNETLSGGLATANLTLFGATVAGSSNDMSGGSGNDTLIAGAGADTLNGGTGANEFLLDSTQTDGAKITIGDFWASSSDTLALKGFTAADVNNILNHGTEQNGAYVVTLSNGGTLTFEGVTSGSQLSGHIVSF